MTDEEKQRAAILDGVKIKPKLRFFDGPIELQVVKKHENEGVWWCTNVEEYTGLWAYEESDIVASVKRGESNES